MQPEVTTVINKSETSSVVTLIVGEQRYSIFLPNHESDYIQKKIMAEKKPYELQMLEDIQQRVQQDDLVLDIGANIGNHTLYIAAISGCKVIAFEPNQALIGALLASIELNDLSSRVSVRALGLGKTKAKGHFEKEFPDNLGAQSIVVGDGGIQIVSLDSLQFEQPVKLLKIDVEGMEFQVLQGAEALLRKDRPILYVECQTENDFRSVTGWLDSQGYSYWDTFNATPTHLFLPNEQVDIDRRLSRLQFKDVLGVYKASEKLAATRIRLEDANTKYRTASETISSLKERLAEEKTQHKNTQARLTEESEFLNTRLNEVNLKYRAITEQIPGLKSTIKELTVAKNKAEAALNAVNQDTLLAKQQVAQLQDELAALQIRLAGLDQEHQLQVAQIAALESQLEQERASRQEAETVLLATRQQAEETLHRQESERHALEQERAALNQQVEQLSQHSAHQHETLKQHEQHAALLAAEASALQARLGSLDHQYNGQVAQVGALEIQLVQEQACRQQLKNELIASRHRLDEALRQQESARNALQLYEAQLGERDQALRLATKQSTALQAQVCLEAASRDAAEALLETSSEQWEDIRQRLEGELSSTKTRLHVANQKYRAVTGEQIPHLKADLENLLSKTAAQQNKLEELADTLHRANAKRHLAEQRLIKTRSSLTYQLGYQLKAGASSLGSFVRLPGSLLSLYKQASKQRKETQQKSIGRDTAPKALPSPDLMARQHANADNHQPAMLEGAEQTRSSMLKQGDEPASQLKVACIMDEFTYGSYRYECSLQQLTPGNWKSELQAFQPELLFIESAWRGKDELWGSKVGHNSQELQSILAWCNERKVPTVFWNKEDPVHFETFLTTAKQFDFVFTTDIDCIHRYKAALGHERVYLLPFACQPAVHNPIELYQRKDAFCFAGAYYLRYPERTRDLGNLVSQLPSFRPLDIYDRNYGKDDPSYQFPADYHPYIIGTLPFTQIDKAYKGYRYAINLNSIKQSQSMFARRVFELLGCNTVTVSNFSRGVRLLFGDLVITTDDGAEMVRRLSKLVGSDEASGKLRLAALRKVMQEHTYTQRFNYVMAKVTGEPNHNPLPDVAVVAYAADDKELDSLLTSMQRQQYANARMQIIVRDTNTAKREIADARICLLPQKLHKKRTLRELAGSARWLAGMVAGDYYGPNYLLDIALATGYSQARVIGKSAQHVYSQSAITLENQDCIYRPVAELAARSAAIDLNLVADLPVLDWAKSLNGHIYQHQQTLAIDPYNYCRLGAHATVEEVSERVDDIKLNTGLSIDELQARAEAIPPAQQSEDQSPTFDARRLEHIFGPLRNKVVKLELDNNLWRVTSQLEDGKHEYLYAANDLTLMELGCSDRIELFLDASPGLNLQLVLLFLDAQKQRISHVIHHANRNQSADIPPETAYIRFGWRVYGGGCAEVKALVLGHRDLQPSEMLEQAEHLLLTNHYPAYDDLYRNGFVHSRVTAYQERGVRVDVFRLRKNESVSYHEFQNVDVITGDSGTLDKMLGNGRYKSLLVHFLDPDMWEVIRKHMNHTKVIVWVHGAEIQPWWRREYNYSSEEQLQLAKHESDKRMAFWRSVLQPMPANLKLVFVSRYFAEEVMEDLGFRIAESQYEIIHNPINTELFSYQEKPVEQRKKILSIRPYTSKTYANDLSVKAIELLSKKPWFNELEFRMIGDGPLFEETLEPLKKLSNVRIERGFLTQSEIASLHKDYGVFLCPSRMDTQGVSRDEAMASGLVPISSSVAAIPEFVDDGCAYLDEPGAFLGLSAAIESLYLEPDKFMCMSMAAANRVFEQSSSLKIIALEMSVFE